MILESNKIISGSFRIALTVDLEVISRMDQPPRILAFMLPPIIHPEVS